MSLVTESYPIDDRKTDFARQYWLRVLSTDSWNSIIPMSYSEAANGTVEEPLPLTITGVTFERLVKLTAGSPLLLYVTLLAGVKTCLYKYSRTNLIVVGGGPRRAESESSGTDSPLAIIDQFEENLSFRSLLLNIKDSVIEAHQCQDYPLSAFADDVEIGEGRQFWPQVSVVVKDFHGDIPPLRSGISLRFQKLLTEVSGTVDFDRRLFDPDIVQRFIDDFLSILGLALQDTAIPVNELTALTPTERRQLISEWNNTSRPSPENHCAYELFVSQASNTPDAVAIICDDQYLTYLELNRRANKLAHYLKIAGIGPEKRVALFLERGLEMVVGVLGALKAGGVYVPLDPAYPPERLEYLINDAQVSILLTQQRLLKRLPSVEARVVDLDSVEERISELSEGSTERELAAENLAYVIYTSGSTGKPKGVAVHHQALVERIVALIEAYALAPTDRLLQFVSPSFDAFGEEVFTTLSCGASLVIDPRSSSYMAHDLFSLVERLDITVLHIPPAYWHQLVDELSRSRRLVSRQLRLFITGGESPSVEKLKKWAVMTDGRSRFVNAYGPTEATITSMVYEPRMDPNQIYLQTGVPIGRPIANTQIYILDNDQEVAQMGGKGEIYIGGAGIARGYLGQPDLSAEKFIPHPFSEEAGARLYRTGDVGRYLLDGNIEFIGRVDDQVKLRGYRIELGEIEAMLNAHQSVRQSAVVVNEDERGRKHLCGYVVGGKEATAQLLKGYLKGCVPEYMVPEVIIKLAEMPLTTNGKIDRKRLPLMEDASRQKGSLYVGARKPMEEILIGIFEGILKLDRIGVHDNFFENGGDSLLAIQVVSRVRDIFGVEIGFRAIFEDTTVAGLARRIEEAIGTGDKEAPPPLVRASEEERQWLSFSQQRLWFLTHFEKASEAYHITSGLRLSGDLDRVALRHALDRIVARHEALRTTFSQLDGRPIQLIGPPDAGFSLLEDDLSLEEDPDSELHRLFLKEATVAFDLETGPLIRGRLVEMSEEEHALILTMHHIVSDGWSMGILFNELSALYRGYVEGAEEALPELGAQYADYAAWQRRWLSGEVLMRQAEYWKGALRGAPVLLELPTDRPRPVQQDYAGEVVEVELDEELVRGLKALSQRQGATLYMTLLSGWGGLLTRLSGQEEVVIGTPVANRTRPEIEGLIGFFVNTLALRIEVGRSATVEELMESVKRKTLEAQENQDIPFEQVVEIAQPPRSLAHAPVFQAVLAWLNTPERELDLPGLEITPLTPPHVSAQFDLSLLLQEREGRIVGVLEYATALFDRATAQRYLEYWTALLTGMVENEKEAVGRLPLLGENERRQVLMEWNATAADYPKEKLIHELFEEQVEKRPDAIALIHEDRSLTYGQLNARADRLAHHLRGLGVVPDTRVAILLERSIDLVTAQLATLKCGAAYVPIDPTFPHQRQVFMAIDCEARVIVTIKSVVIPDQLSAPRVDLDDLEPGEAGVCKLDRCLKGEMTAYVMYTSGSAGRPKGVMAPIAR